MRPVAKLFWFGVLLLLGAGVFLGFKYDYLANGIRVQGTVVEFARRHSRNSWVYYPVVEYVAAGQRHRVQSSMGMSPNPYRRGEKVAVIYLSREPRAAILGEFLNLYLMPTLCVLVGGACMAPALKTASCGTNFASTAAPTPDQRLPTRAVCARPLGSRPTPRFNEGKDRLLARRTGGNPCRPCWCWVRATARNVRKSSRSSATSPSS